GHTLATRSDTETVVHLYEEYGLDLFGHLRGMYAFALWDARRGRLTLAVDHIGIKPLYVAQAGTRLVFASEAKALFAYGPEVRKELNTPALDTYMSFGFMVGGETLFQGVRRLDPGTALIVEGGQTRTIRHWQMRYAPNAVNGDERAIIGQVRQTLDEAVRLHLRSDVPLGLFLSGGVDSASMLGLMARHEPGRINTFTVGYLDGQHTDNELEAARQTAQAFHSAHHELLLSAAEWWAFAEQYAYAHDEPNANPSAVSLLALSRLTAQSVKVVLNGIGSDELFGGYPVHRALPIAIAQERRLRALLPRPVRRAGLWLGTHIEGLYPYLSRFRLLGALPHVLPPLYDRLADEPEHLRRVLSFDGTVFSDGLRRALFAFPTNGNAARAFETLVDAAPNDDLANRVHFLQMYRWLPGNGLLSADKVSMAYSLEGRVPFFDRILMEVAGTIPPALRGRENKYVLRAAIDDTLPESIRTRAKKPFGTPIRAWFGGALRERLREVLYDPAARQRPYFRPDAYRRLLDEHFRGRAVRTEIIWRLVNLELWQRAFFGG
ncbi:MAG: asparagine synthase (glutamine-hydrolyzing), partial [Anaerolineae bacterium]|nr:asparagine synthase (glutamine-hydrolyzing) [Anaerolineae bacterium]